MARQTACQQTRARWTAELVRIEIIQNYTGASKLVDRGCQDFCVIGTSMAVRKCVEAESVPSQIVNNAYDDIGQRFTYDKKEKELSTRCGDW